MELSAGLKRDGSLRVEGRKEREKGDEVYGTKQIGAPAMAVLPNTDTYPVFKLTTQSIGAHVWPYSITVHTFVYT